MRPYSGIKKAGLVCPWVSVLYTTTNNYRTSTQNCIPQSVKGLKDTYLKVQLESYVTLPLKYIRAIMVVIFTTLSAFQSI
jgi:hypothetical protein